MTSHVKLKLQSQGPFWSKICEVVMINVHTFDLLTRVESCKGKLLENVSAFRVCPVWQVLAQRPCLAPCVELKHILISNHHEKVKRSKRMSHTQNCTDKITKNLIIIKGNRAFLGKYVTVSGPVFILYSHGGIILDSRDWLGNRSVTYTTALTRLEDIWRYLEYIQLFNSLSIITDYMICTSNSSSGPTRRLLGSSTLAVLINPRMAFYFE